MLVSGKSRTGTELVHRMLVGSVLLLVASAVCVAIAAFAPLPAAPDVAAIGPPTAPVGVLSAKPNLGPLLVKMAGKRLIRPSQVQAAVKDTGAAQRLLAKLNLQGVVDMRGNLIAYIGVKGQGVKTVRQGGSVLEFVVKSIEPNRVVLSLQGVEVELTH